MPPGLVTTTRAIFPTVEVGTCTDRVRESTKPTVAATPSKATVVVGVKPIPRIVATAIAAGVFFGTQAGLIERASIARTGPVEAKRMATRPAITNREAERELSDSAITQ